jgi:serine/threonine-protein kinase RsbW
MPDKPNLDGAVTLTMPATSPHLRLARLVASGVASLSDVDFDTIEDLRIAVDELCTLLLDAADDGAHLHLSYHVGDGVVGVDGSVPVPDGTPLELPELTRTILETVIDRYDVATEEGRLSFSLVRSLPTAPR